MDASADSRASNLSTQLLTTGTHSNVGVAASGGRVPALPLAKPALKSRVSGKICALCTKEARGPHEARCGHVCCYECWVDRLKVRMLLCVVRFILLKQVSRCVFYPLSTSQSQKTCPKCGKEARKKELSRVYLT